MGMDLINGLITNLIYLLFPLMLYTIYISYIITFNEDEKDIYLDLALFTSLILMMRFANKNEISQLMLMNIPLLIAFLKDKKLTALIISFLLIYYLSINPKIDIKYIFIEYLSYYIIYLIFDYKKIDKSKYMNLFISLKSFMLGFFVFYLLLPNNSIIVNIIYLISLVLLFVLGTNLILFFIKKGDSMIELSTIMNKLNKEKALKLSLFKITHEIKNPISVCKGYLEMFDYNDVEKSRKYLPIIKDEVNRTLNVINDFSLYGKIKIEKDIADITLLLEDIKATYEYLLNEEKLKLKINIPDEEIYINIDYNRIKQVLVNVIKNAIEAKPLDKPLIITIDLVKFRDSVKIIITDNGIGMDKDTIDKIYNIFYTTKDKGTGLGVALSKEIIELHNGSINYKSKLNYGTTVTIKLPIK